MKTKEKLHGESVVKLSEPRQLGKDYMEEVNRVFATY